MGGWIDLSYGLQASHTGAAKTPPTTAGAVPVDPATLRSQLDPDEEKSIAQLWYYSIGSTPFECMCKCCRSQHRERDARFQAATVAHFRGRTDVADTLEAASDSERSKIRAALGDIEQGRENLEAIVLDSVVVPVTSTMPCPSCPWYATLTESLCVQDCGPWRIC